MKKLTASIFASLLTVVTVGAANANIASQGYVDEKVGTVTTALGNKADKTELGKYATTEALTSGLAGKLDTTGTAAKATADAAGNVITDTYATKTELGAKADSATVTALDKAAEKIANRVTEVSGTSDDAHYPTAKAVWDIVQAETADIASTGDLSALTTRVTTAEGEIDTLQTDMAGKANTADLGDLATLDAVGSAQITDGSITSADISATAAIKRTQLEEEVQTSLGKADTALQKTAADAAYAVKSTEQTATAANNNAHKALTNIGTLTTLTTDAKTNTVAAINEVAGEAAAAKTAADGAQSDVDALGLRVDTAESDIDGIQTQLGTMATSTTIGDLQNLTTTAKTNLVGAINEVDADATKALGDAATAKSAAETAQDAAEAAQATADAAIPAPDGECSNPTNKCVLTYNNSAYAWEVIERGTNGQ